MICIPQITAMTAASPLIAKTYETLYPQHQVTTVNNAFSKKNQPTQPRSQSGPLKIIWFSQVVGLDRGLAEFLQGMQRAKNVPIQLNVLGLCSDDVQQHLLGSAPSELHQIMLHPPMPESALFAFIAEHEIGLALEVRQLKIAKFAVPTSCILLPSPVATCSFPKPLLKSSFCASSLMRVS